MLRWQSVLVAAVLTATACGDESGEGPEQPALPSPDSGASVVFDAGVTVPNLVPASDASTASARDASAEADTGVLQVDGGLQAIVDGGSALLEAPKPGNPCGAGPEPLAANVTLRELAVYQTVKVPLYKDGSWVTTRNATLVQGKKSLVRAFVDLQTSFAPHALRALLTLETDAKKTVLLSERTISKASTDDVADSTFDFAVAGELVAGSTQVSISVIETTCIAPAVGSGAARLPAAGTRALNADAVGKLRVVLVPVTLSGRTPDTSEAQLGKIRDALRAYYPVAEVDVTARAALVWSNPVQSTGTGWTELLNQIQKERTKDAVASNVYYFGLIAPAVSFREYCRSGCVLGLAPQVTTISRNGQIGLGIGFVDDNTYTTIVHELGHAHGLPHAPCVPRGGTIEDADMRFPYTGAKIGSWGWDSRSAKLMSPAIYLDVMSYCDPVWISDYNYQKVATRSKAVNNAAFIYNSDKLAPQTWHGIILSGDGSARWAGLTLHEQPGELSDARALDEAGDELSQISVARVALSEGSDSFLYIPEPEAGWSAIDLGDRIVTLQDIAPAL